MLIQKDILKLKDTLLSVGGLPASSLQGLNILYPEISTLSLMKQQRQYNSQRNTMPSCHHGFQGAVYTLKREDAAASSPIEVRSSCCFLSTSPGLEGEQHKMLIRSNIFKLSDDFLFVIEVSKDTSSFLYLSFFFLIFFCIHPSHLIAQKIKMLFWICTVKQLYLIKSLINWNWKRSNGKSRLNCILLFRYSFIMLCVCTVMYVCFPFYSTMILSRRWKVCKEIQWQTLRCRDLSYEFEVAHLNIYLVREDCCVTSSLLC